jgi:CBS domain-containing protein
MLDRRKERSCQQAFGATPKLQPMVVGDTSPHRLPLELALPRTVGELMIPNPRTLPADASLADVRRAFEQSSQRLVLLVDGTAFRGAIDRDAIDPEAVAGTPAARYANGSIATVTPATAIADAIVLLEHSGEPRLVVLDEDGQTLRGLLCFNRSSASFCLR